LWKYGFASGKKGSLKFRTGVEVSGTLKSLVRRDGKTLVIAFEDCTVKQTVQVDPKTKTENKTQAKTETILFEPSWGVFDMACGESVRSVFGGAADRKEYLAVTGGFHQTPQKPKTNLTAENKKLNELYKKVRELREKKIGATELKTEFEALTQLLEKDFPQDWLLTYEMLEMALKKGELKLFSENAHKRLEQMARSSSSSAVELGNGHSELIRRGLEAL
jgi:phenylalanine-4-hydroxylase